MACLRFFFKEIPALSLIGTLLLFALKAYFWIIVASVGMSWLIAFDVINIRNPQAANLVRLLERLTEPVYRKLRRFIPPIAGIDLTPIVVIFGITLLQNLIFRLFIAGY